MRVAAAATAEEVVPVAPLESPVASPMDTVAPLEIVLPMDFHVGQAIAAFPETDLTQSSVMVSTGTQVDPSPLTVSTGTQVTIGTQVDPSPLTVSTGTQVTLGTQAMPAFSAKDRRETIEWLVDIAKRVGKVYDFSAVCCSWQFWYAAFRIPFSKSTQVHLLMEPALLCVVIPHEWTPAGRISTT